MPADKIRSGAQPGLLAADPVCGWIHTRACRTTPKAISALVKQSHELITRRIRTEVKAGRARKDPATRVRFGCMQSSAHPSAKNRRSAAHRKKGGLTRGTESLSARQGILEDMAPNSRRPQQGVHDRQLPARGRAAMGGSNDRRRRNTTSSTNLGNSLQMRPGPRANRSAMPAPRRWRAIWMTAFA